MDQGMNRNRLKEMMFPGKFRMPGSRMMERYKSMMQRPVFPKRDLARMLADLAEISPEEWGIYAFSRDPLRARFQEAECRELAVQAISCGQAYARQMAETYSGVKPLGILRKLGIKTEFTDIPSNTDRVLFAEFVEPDEVFVYLDALNKAEKLVKDEKVRAVLTKQFDMRQTILAHELFHVLEFQNKKEVFTQTYRHTLWKLGPFKSTSRVLALGELAAMAFAQEMCGLPYSVYVIDVLLLYGYSDNEASGLYEEMMTSTGRKPCPALTHLDILARESSVLG